MFRDVRDLAVFACRFVKRPARVEEHAHHPAVLVKDSCFRGFMGKSSSVPGGGFVSVVGAFFEGSFFVREDAHVWVGVVQPPGADAEGRLEP